jgi:hypothetical protein
MIFKTKFLQQVLDKKPYSKLSNGCLPFKANDHEN